MPAIINSDNGVISGTSGLKTSGSNDGLLDFQSNGTRIAGITTSAFQVGTDNISSVNSLGFRNRIINGDMRIDQRNAGASVTPGDGNFTLDRWKMSLSQASKLSVQRAPGGAISVSPPTGFTNYLAATSLSAYSILTGDTFGIYQPIEGFNVSDLGFGSANAQSVTVSFWVRASLTGTYSVALYNSAGNRSCAVGYTVNSANTWEQKSVTFTGDTSGTWLTDNGIGIQVYWNLGSGATLGGATSGTWNASLKLAVTGQTSVVGTNGATFYITGVQLEAGSVATPFERRDYGRELMMCQRYFESSDFTLTFGCYAVNGSNIYSSWSFKQTKRANPTMVFTDAGSLGFPAGAPTLNSSNIGAFSVTKLANSTVAGYYQFSWTAAAEL